MLLRRDCVLSRLTRSRVRWRSCRRFFFWPSSSASPILDDEIVMIT